MSRIVFSLCMITALLVSPAMLLAASSSEEEKGETSPEALAAEGLAKLLDAMEAFIDQIPQYEAPEVLENGDIIIRRRNKEEAPQTPPDEDETRTSPVET